MSIALSIFRNENSPIKNKNKAMVKLPSTVNSLRPILLTMKNEMIEPIKFVTPIRIVPSLGLTPCPVSF